MELPYLHQPQFESGVVQIYLVPLFSLKESSYDQIGPDVKSWLVKNSVYIHKIDFCQEGVKSPDTSFSGRALGLVLNALLARCGGKQLPTLYFSSNDYGFLAGIKYLYDLVSFILNDYPHLNKWILKISSFTKRLFVQLVTVLSLIEIADSVKELGIFSYQTGHFLDKNSPHALEGTTGLRQVKHCFRSYMRTTKNLKTLYVSNGEGRFFTGEIKDYCRLLENNTSLINVYDTRIDLLRPEANHYCTEEAIAITTRNKQIRKEIYACGRTILLIRNRGMDSVIGILPRDVVKIIAREVLAELQTKPAKERIARFS